MTNPTNDDLSNLTDTELKGMALEAFMTIDYCKNGKFDNDMAAKYGSVEALYEMEKSIKDFIQEVGLETALQVQEGFRDLLMIELSKRQGMKTH
jgi:hypothetical protein